ncbi:MAG: SusD/RagB family nutrient-binding outer membrane lipoprotein [Flammeovirgaceae bacterium]
MKRFNRYIAALVASLFILTSCDFGDINIDPANPIDVPIGSLLPASQAQLAYVLGGDMGRYNGVFTQHYGGISRQHLVIARYGLSESDVNTTWNQLYAGLFQDMTTLITKAEETESPHYSGIAKIIIANMLGAATDVWGNIPYSEAGQGVANLSPAYDTRDQIYTSIHTLLSEARTELGQTSAIAVGAEDLYYGGDIDSWIALSHTLDARYYLHRGNYASALSSAQNGIASNAGDFDFQFGSAATEQNPLYQFMDQRAGDLVMGEFFIELMKDINDPRLSSFATEFDGGYSGAPAGVSQDASLPGAFYAAPNSIVTLASYVENQFIMAEVNFRQGSTIAATTNLTNALNASLTKITGATDAVFVTAETATVSLESIMTHKYIALFSQTETWNDVRRTGLPVLTPANESQLPTGEMPSRWAYPQGERDFNGANWSANTPSEDVNQVLITDLDW